MVGKFVLCLLWCIDLIYSYIEEFKRNISWKSSLVTVDAFSIGELYEEKGIPGIACSMPSVIPLRMN